MCDHRPVNGQLDGYTGGLVGFRSEQGEQLTNMHADRRAGCCLTCGERTGLWRGWWTR